MKNCYKALGIVDNNSFLVIGKTKDGDIHCTFEGHNLNKEDFIPLIIIIGCEKMGNEFKTRKEIYDFYDWMKESKLKKYLDKIPLNIIKTSLDSNGLNPKSVCLYGNHTDCRCNTCIKEK